MRVIEGGRGGAALNKTHYRFQLFEKHGVLFKHVGFSNWLFQHMSTWAHNTSLHGGDTAVRGEGGAGRREVGGGGASSTLAFEST